MKLEPSFLKEKSEYRRTYYPIPHYIEQCAHYLAREKGIPFEKALEYVKGKFKSGEVKPSERSANILAKDENGDRYKKTVTLFDYFRTIKHHNLRVAPTFTTYVGPDVKVSLYGGYIQEKAKHKSTIKTNKAIFFNKSIIFCTPIYCKIYLQFDFLNQDLKNYPTHIL